MNMYLHELGSLRKSTIIWTCAMVALAGLYLSIYPSIVNDAADFKAMLGNYPESVRAMMGISLDDITSMLGYYSLVFAFIPLLGAIQAMNLGVSIFSKESRERTTDFLLVKPVSRVAIVSAKLFASLTTILVTDVFYYAAVSAMAAFVATSDYSVTSFFLISLTLFFIQLFFLAIGMFVSVFFTRLKSVLPLSLGTVFGFYMIGALIATGEDDWERFISPFRYFDNTYIIDNSGYEIPYLITAAIIILAAITASYFIYTKKDIPAAS